MNLTNERTVQLKSSWSIRLDSIQITEYLDNNGLHVVSYKNTTSEQLF